MSRTITIDIFNPASIDAAVKEIRDYADWVKRKTDELRERVAYFIAKDASAVFNTAVAEDDLWEGAITGSVDVVVEDNGNMTLVIANGTDAVFMEFGAGVYYNGAVGSSPNPLGAVLGFTIGSYGTFTEHLARLKAQSILQGMRDGIDPRDLKRQDEDDIQRLKNWLDHEATSDGLSSNGHREGPGPDPRVRGGEPCRDIPQ
jgi:hypothetical protein